MSFEYQLMREVEETESGNSGSARGRNNSQAAKSGGTDCQNGDLQSSQALASSGSSTEPEGDEASTPLSSILKKRGSGKSNEGEENAEVEMDANSRSHTRQSRVTFSGEEMGKTAIVK